MRNEGLKVIIKPHIDQLLIAELEHPQVYMKKDQKNLERPDLASEITQGQTLNRMAAGRNLADFHLNGS